VTRFYIDSSGAYLGGWDENPPSGAIEVPFPPSDARLVWNGSAWTMPYKQALDSLNSAYQADVAKFNNAFALALLSDGPSEATKIAAIRPQYEARRTKHTADLAALKTQYGV
jgi:hypothetical protein